MKKKILVIEDEKLLGEMYKDKLNQAGLEVILAESAEEGIRKLPEAKPDLVLLDILLPRENGISFLGKMRKKDGFASLPVVAFSNFDDPDTKKEAYRLGVKDYLIKTNYTPNEIVEKIKSYLKE